MTRDKVRTALNAELTLVVIDAREEYHENIFRSEEHDIEIEKFIETSDFYKENRWRGIPETVCDQKELYEPFSKLLEHILGYFGYPARGRVFLDTHNVEIPHIDGSTTAPTFMVMGVGPNFLVTKGEEHARSIKPCYRHCASPGYITTEKSKLELSNTTQVAVYARECLAEQLNRRFVYAIMLTESNMRLSILDRSGVMHSNFFDIHKNPFHFVRIVLGYCSPDDEKIGFDTSIFWEKRDDEESLEADEELDTADGEHNKVNQVVAESIDAIYQTDGDDTDDDRDEELEATRQAYRHAQLLKQQLRENQKIGKRYHQFIRLNNHWDKYPLGEKIYQVKKPLFSHRAMRGRGTHCWTVFDPEDDNKTLVIKDSWRSCEQNSESKMLADVVGLPGVGQMIAYQDDGRDSISKFRAVGNCDMTDSQKHDRIFSRIVLEEYGESLENFKNPLHLLCAFRDAIKGHRNLWEKDILHRDVSLNNILFGKEGAVDGFKGILIDLDMAIGITGIKPLEATFRAGTRAFQSINVLRSEVMGERARPHDYLDDLESFFYCLAIICCTYTDPGKIRTAPPEMMDFWECESLLNAAYAKRDFIDTVALSLTPYFEKLSDMFTSMGFFLLEHVRSKRVAAARGLAKVKLTDLKEEAKKHYDTFIGYIIKAIEGLSTPVTVVQSEPGSPQQLNLKLLIPVEDPIEAPKRRRTGEIDEPPESEERPPVRIRLA